MCACPREKSSSDNSACLRMSSMYFTSQFEESFGSAMCKVDETVSDMVPKDSEEAVSDIS